MMGISRYSSAPCTRNRLFRLRLPSPLLLLLFANLFTQSSLYPQTDTNCAITWTSVEQLSFDSTFSVGAQAIAQGDTFYVMWINEPFWLDDVGGLFFRRSVDSGKTFSPAILLHSADSLYGVYGMMAASGPNVYLTYLDRLDTFPWGEMAIDRSTDGGTSWSRSPQVGFDYVPRAMTASDSSVYIRFDYDDTSGGRRKSYSGCLVSHDYGVTYQIAALNLPLSSTDGSSPYHKLSSFENQLHSIYARGLPLGVFGFYEIIYSRSENQGLSWSIPDTISVIDSMHSVWPGITNDEKGNLYVVWYDHKYGSVDGYSGSVILRKSMDGGLSWGPEEVLTSMPTAIGPKIVARDSVIVIAWDNLVGSDRYQPVLRYSDDAGMTWSNMITVDAFGGDVDLALGNRTVFLSWFLGLDVFYRTGILSASCFPRSIPTGFVLLQNYPNPVNAGTVIRYGIQPGKYRVTLTIYNVLGQVVRTLLDDVEQEGGYYQTGWDAIGVSSGVYFYRLSAGSYSTANKMVVLK